MVTLLSFREKLPSLYVPVRVGDEDSPSRCCAALLALHADELADSCIEPPEALSFLPNPHTGLAFLFDVRAVVFVLAEEPISARTKLSFLRGVVCRWRLPLFASSAASSKCAWRRRRAGARGDGLQSQRQVVTVCLRECLRACRDIVIK